MRHGVNIIYLEQCVWQPQGLKSQYNFQSFEINTHTHSVPPNSASSFGKSQADERTKMCHKGGEEAFLKWKSFANNQHTYTHSRARQKPEFSNEEQTACT